MNTAKIHTLKMKIKSKVLRMTPYFFDPASNFPVKNDRTYTLATRKNPAKMILDSFCEIKSVAASETNAITEMNKRNIKENLLKFFGLIRNIDIRIKSVKKKTNEMIFPVLSSNPFNGRF